MLPYNMLSVCNLPNEPVVEDIDNMSNNEDAVETKRHEVNRAKEALNKAKIKLKTEKIIYTETHKNLWPYVLILLALVALSPVSIGYLAWCNYEYDRTLDAPLRNATEAGDVNMSIRYLQETIDVIEERFSDDDYTSWYRTPHNTWGFIKEKLQGYLTRLIGIEEVLSDGALLNSTLVMITYGDYEDIKSRMARESETMRAGWLLKYHPFLYYTWIWLIPLSTILLVWFCFKISELKKSESSLKSKMNFLSDSIDNQRKELRKLRGELKEAIRREKNVEG